jgi:probable rRNA maturation factor
MVHDMTAVSDAAMVNLELDLQIAAEIGEMGLNVPEKTTIERWILAALATANATGDNQLTVRIVDEAEIKTLNETYRHKPGATNVLSFPFDAPPDVPLAFIGKLLGDIVICAPVVQREAQQQQKPLQHHWAHMIVHGTLHLLGYDHLSEQQAEEMEAMEVEVLSGFGIPNPYGETQAQ